MDQKDLNVKANDARIPLSEDRPTSPKKVIIRGPVETQEEIEGIDAEGRRQRRAFRRDCRRRRRLPGLTKQDLQNMRKAEKSALAEMKKDNMRRQAQCYARRAGISLPDDLSYRGYQTIAIRCFLPQYTRGEELASAITHVVGGALGIVMLIVGIYYAATTQKPFFGVGQIYPFQHGVAIGAMFVFALGAIFLYTMSSIYHFLWVNPGKKVLRIIDHCTIYFLIAASYTPMSLLGLPGAYGAGMTWPAVVLCLEWGLGVLLTVFNCLWLNDRWVIGFSMAGYILLGWLIVGFAPLLLDEVGTGGFLVLLFGGVAYTLGAIFHGVGHKVRYMHALAHSSYVVGTLLHFLGILLYFVIGI